MVLNTPINGFHINKDSALVPQERGGDNMLKKHQFWAVVAVVGMVMCVFTGHAMVAGHKPKAITE